MDLLLLRLVNIYVSKTVREKEKLTCVKSGSE